MTAIWNHCITFLKRLWIRSRGLSPVSQERVEELVKDKAYYTLFDNIYSQAHKAGAWRLFDRNIYILIEEVIQEFLAQYRFNPHNTKAIDFGCGEGGNALYLAQRSFQVTGVDISPAAIARAQEIAAQAGVVIRYCVGDVLNLSMCPNDFFDFGINIGCLHMLVTEEHRRGHLREMARVLKPGGLLLSFNKLARRDIIIKDPDRYIQSFIAVDETKQVEVDGEIKEIRFPGVGFRNASEAQYHTEFTTAGFEILKTEAVSTVPLWKQLLRPGQGSSQRYLVLHARKKQASHAAESIV